MFTFDQLQFRPTKVVGNTIATVKLDNGYQFDVIRIASRRIYKIKGFEIINGNKLYQEDYFDGYFSHPELTSKEALIAFISLVSKFEKEEDEEPEYEQPEEMED